ncbi:Outer membrane receptor for ferrienterochelin and colicins [Flexibacter flexilis DSM 6793]|uniref:Outer membrane receptor for ferrienterochelin and colicins n=1 Tax=Flexibacter flexilis DSM 6793 TaxID=927664 RepID=A0A1I1D7F1_9BACT|nr:TonB-dependent receptor [Flexibacter flexilis]SFB70737.1 Outer membrane receptor for ferrienterochelin and colicins [Flexibacter flexilis DSM 6793]
MKKKYFLLVAYATFLGQMTAYAQTDTTQADLQKLLNIDFEDTQVRKSLDATKVESASKSKENLADAAGLLTVIDRQEMAAFGGNDLSDVLNRVVGMYMAGSYYFPNNMATIRGDLQTHTASHVLILIDGRPCRESFYGGVDLAIFNTFPLEALERIEIIRGPGSVLYGTNAFTGVINLIMKQEHKNVTKVSTQVGSFGTVGASLLQSQQKEDFKLTSAVRYFNQQGWDLTATDAKGVTKTVNYGQQNLSVSMLGSYKKISFRGFYGNSLRDVIGEKPEWPSDGTTNKLNTYRAFADIGYRHDFSSKWYATHNFTLNGFSQRSVRSDRPVHFFSNDGLLEVTHFIRPTEKVNIVAGLLATRLTGRGDAVDKNTNQPTEFVKAYDEWRGAAYVQADYRPSAHLKLIAGAQANKVPSFQADFAPRWGLIANLNEATGIKVLYGNAFKSASQSERYSNISSNVGNPNLVPETVGTFDAQWFYQDLNYQLAVGYFNSHQKNTLVRKTINGIAYYFNEGTLNSQGVEVEAKIMPTQQLTLTLSSSYQENKNDKGWYNMNTTPNATVKGGVSYRTTNGLAVSVFDSWFSKPATLRNADTGADVTTPNPTAQAFHLLSANVSVDFQQLFDTKKIPALNLACYADNLLNEKIYTPEFSRRNINSLPLRGGRAFYFTFAVKF